MKKIITCYTLVFYLAFLFPVQSIFAQNDNDNYFIVTAYYSPLPNQDHYITGNYEDEIRLNGQGIAGASGKSVHSGMLAAPKKYAFGTKIYLEGLGVGSVEDRGGAIVPAGQRGYSHDRIDVWMGTGEEGLKRAMYWGKRKVSGKIVESNTTVTLDYSVIPSPDWAVPKTTTLYGKSIQVEQTNTSIRPDIFSVSLGKGSDSGLIKELQDILVEIGYLDDLSYEVGKYDSATISAIFTLQIETEILSNETELGAGSYGPKTRKELKVLYEEFLIEQERKEMFEALYKQLAEESLIEATYLVQSMNTPKYGDITPEVRQLQILLSDLGFFDYKDTAIFGVKTQNSLIDYQIEKNIILSGDEIGAGIFGPKTKAHFIQDISEKLLDSKLVENNLVEQFKLYKDSENGLVEKNGADVSLEEKHEFI